MDRYRIEFMIMSFWHENYCTHVIQNKSFAHQHFLLSGATKRYVEGNWKILVRHSLIFKNEIVHAVTYRKYMLNIISHAYKINCKHFISVLVLLNKLNDFIISTSASTIVFYFMLARRHTFKLIYVRKHVHIRFCCT